MQVGVLGPLLVHRDDQVVNVAGTRLRALLIRLAVEPGRRVSVTELVDAVWPDDPPEDPGNALQSLVSRLRRVLGDPALVQPLAAGYRLAITRDAFDATRFTDLVVGARDLVRRGEAEAAFGQLADALALWRGPALADAGDAEFVRAYRSRWEEQHLLAQQDRIGLAIGRGESATVVTELEELVGEHPLREELVAHLMTALAATGRTAEALTRFEETRRHLDEELGGDPGRALQELHLHLLRGDAPLPAAVGTTSVRPRDGNLRSWLTTFVGRAQDLDRVSTALEATRLSTIVGPGGVGKTRLAAEAAGRWHERSGRAAWMVELASVTDGADVAAAVLGALGLRDALIVDRPDRPTQEAGERLLDALVDTECLLVLDNCEHLLEPVATLVDAVLARAPGVTVLATSREPIGIIGETICPVAPLPMPPRPTGTVPLEVAEVTAYPSVRLWLDRAAAARPDFVLDEQNLPAVIDVVRRLDGLPLAIELAAARLRVLPVAEIAARLSDRFRLLTGGSRSGLPRHRTLRAVVAWSWDLLDDDERLLVERLSVFPAGVDVESATAVCADERLSATEVADLLVSLVDKSLMQTIETPTGGLRYRMLETIREYGVERLGERGELGAAHQAHADFFLALAIRMEPVLRGHGQLDALAILNLESDNLVAALRYLGDSGQGRASLELALALTWYWSLIGMTSEAATWLELVVEANRGSDDPYLLYARAVQLISRMTSTDSDSTDSYQTVQTELGSLSDELVDAGVPPFAGLAVMMPMITMFGGRPDLTEAALARSLESDDPWLRAAVHCMVASLAENDGDLDRARVAVDQAHQEFSDLGDSWGLSNVLTVRARLSTLDQRLDDAIADFVEARTHVAAFGSGDDDLFIDLRLADLYTRTGDHARARTQLDLLRSRSEALGRTGERGLFGDAAEATLAWCEGDGGRALELAREVRAKLALRKAPTPLIPHASAIILSGTGAIEALSGHLDAAHADLAAAYRAALETKDMPILSGVGVTVAIWAALSGQPEAAATILGASTQIRGADDPTDVLVRIATSLVEAEVPESEARALYAAGAALTRDEAVGALDPDGLVTALGPA